MAYTYTSNNILNAVGTAFETPSDIRPCLELNDDNDKAAGARQKILKSHVSDVDANINVFFNMKMQLLPDAIARIGRDQGSRCYITRVMT